MRQVYSSSSLLSNIQWLDSPGAHSLSTPYTTTASGWASSPFSKTPLHPHTSASLYTASATSSFGSSKENFPSPGRDGKDSPRLQEALKAERLSPMGGGSVGGVGVGSSAGTAGGSFLNLTSSAGGMYTPSSHLLGPYGSYMSAQQDYSSSGLYSSPGAWMSPSAYSPKLRNKMRLSPPGNPVGPFL